MNLRTPAALVAALLLAGCPSEFTQPVDDLPDAGPLPPGEVVFGAIGRPNRGQRGVRVIVGDRFTETEGAGAFAFEHPPGPLTLHFEAAGFVPLHRAVVVDPAHPAFTAGELVPRGAPQAVDPAAGGEVEAGSMYEDGVFRLQLPPDALVRPDGQPPAEPVTVRLTPMGPFALVEDGSPGEPVGLTDDGATVPLETWSMVEIAAFDADGPLRFAEGVTARLVLPLGSHVIEPAPIADATRPLGLWRHDAERPAWVRDDAVIDPPTEQDGLPAFTVSIDRAGVWQVARPLAAGCVRGVVVDRWGRPMVGARVTVPWAAREALGSATVGADGGFVVRAPAHEKVEVKLRHGAYPGGDRVDVGGVVPDPIDPARCTDVGRWVMLRATPEPSPLRPVAP